MRNVVARSWCGMAMMRAWFEFGRRKKVLSKNLRVIFLSVLVVAFAVSSAFAADYTITWDPALGYGVARDGTTVKATFGNGGNILAINDNGRYSFSDTYGKDAGLLANGPVIDVIQLDADGEAHLDSSVVLHVYPPRD